MRGGRNCDRVVEEGEVAAQLAESQEVISSKGWFIEAKKIVMVVGRLRWPERGCVCGTFSAHTVPGHTNFLIAENACKEPSRRRKIVGQRGAPWLPNWAASSVTPGNLTSMRTWWQVMQVSVCEPVDCDSYPNPNPIFLN